MTYDVTADWLTDQRACAGAEMNNCAHLVGQKVDRSLAFRTLEADARGALWVAIRLLSEEGRKRLIAHTLEIRATLLDAMYPEGRPASLRDALRAAGQDRSARAHAVALRDFWRDEDVERATVDEASAASMAMLAATSYAGGQHRDAERELIEWLADELELV